MYYEINVSLDGRHFFATAKRSITSQNTLKIVYKVFKEKFPASEGYEISVTRYEELGFGVDMEVLNSQ